MRTQTAALLFLFTSLTFTDAANRDDSFVSGEGSVERVVEDNRGRVLKKRKRKKKKKTVEAAPAVRLAPALSTSKQFQIKLVNMGIETRLDQVMQRAASRWEHVIYGDLPNEKGSEDFDWFNGYFDEKYGEDVDDVVIGYEFKYIDGPGRILGKAGPRQYRGHKTNGAYSTISGIMVFDSSDMLSYSSADQEAIMVHEMGHVLGIGKRNKSICANACKPATRSSPTLFPEYDEAKCPHAGAMAVSMGLIPKPELLKMETRGGKGSSCVHFEDL